MSRLRSARRRPHSDALGRSAAQRGAAPPREAASDAQPLVLRGELIELGAVERQLGRARVFRKPNLARAKPSSQSVRSMAMIRRDAAAAADQKHAVHLLLGRTNSPSACVRPRSCPPRVVAQVARDPALGVRGHGQPSSDPRSRAVSRRESSCGQANSRRSQRSPTNCPARKAAPFLVWGTV